MRFLFIPLYVKDAIETMYGKLAGRLWVVSVIISWASTMGFLNQSLWNSTVHITMVKTKLLSLLSHIVQVTK